MSELRETDVAIIGMAGRFPGCRNLDEYWEKLKAGTDLVSWFEPDELRPYIREEMLANPSYVPAKGYLEDSEYFDAEFFGYTPREAEILDPQHRVFQECCHEALEDAGYCPEKFEGVIGLYGGMSYSSYTLANLYSHLELFEAASALQVLISNDKDYLVTRTAYKLGLRGPALTVQTACSTSLVAVHLACQCLLTGEADIVLAGGVSVTFPARAGYLFHAGGVLTPDGRCRPFDADARGTLVGNGVGVVVLRPLGKALEARDPIRAVIRGSAINNDGSTKIGFTAPAVDGQARVVQEALELAELTPSAIGYVEAHGTGTPLGDPIEFRALRKAGYTGRPRSCAIGSVKGNFGHLDAAAGIASLIKATLTVQHGEIAPSLHFARPNPALELESTPFYVPMQRCAFEGTPRRAAVSSFGIGGTNAHVVLEQAPSLPVTAASTAPEALVLSARHPESLDRMIDVLAAHLEAHPELPLSAVAHTLQVGRKSFRQRCVLVCRDLTEAARALRARDREQLEFGLVPEEVPRIVFLFPGQGAQYAGMGATLYRDQPVYRDAIDACQAQLRSLLGDRAPALFAVDAPAELVDHTAFTQPYLFATEYALTRLWLSWGVLPTALAGHSLGELVAACVAGVFGLPDAIRIAALRGKFMAELEPGGMLSLQLSAAEAERYTNTELVLAASNGFDESVLSGPRAAIERVQARLAAEQRNFRLLRTSHAFHHPSMEPAARALEQEIGRLRLADPQLPIVSSMTGTWLTPAQATDPKYWARQICAPVRFADALTTLLEDPQRVFVEVGPGESLSRLIARHPAGGRSRTVARSLTARRAHEEESAVMVRSAGRLWSAGCEIDWNAARSGESPGRVPLPGYAFRRQRYWIEPKSSASTIVQLGSAVPAERASEPRFSARSRPPEPLDNELEQAIARIWEDVLGIRPIGATDDFLELGGSSLLAGQVVAGLQAAFPITIGVELLIRDAPTIRQLARAVEAELCAALEKMSDEEAEALFRAAPR